MRLLFSRSFLSIAACLLVGMRPAASAQTGSNPPVEERGWGSSWLQPANEQQRKLQELSRQIAAAENARNYHAVFELSTRFIALEPSQPYGHVTRGWNYVHLGQYDQALADFNQAWDIAQRSKQPAMLASILACQAVVHEHRKELVVAAADYEKSLQLGLKDDMVFNSLAWLRSTAPDGTLRDGREGVRLAQKAVALYNTTRSYIPMDTLAAAYAESGDYPRAMDCERRAMTAAEAQIKDPAKAKKFQAEAAARLQLFEGHHAYHAELP